MPGGGAEGAFPPPFAALPLPRVFTALETAERATMYVSVPGKERPIESPVMAGLRPMRVMIASAFFATFTMVRTSTIHGSTSSPLGM